VGNYFLQNYKIHKYFLQNLLRKVFYTKYFAKKLAAISYNFFFITKFISISYKNNFKTKLTRNMSFFSSVASTKCVVTRVCCSLRCGSQFGASLVLLRDSCSLLCVVCALLHILFVLPASLG